MHISARRGDATRATACANSNDGTPDGPCAGSAHRAGLTQGFCVERACVCRATVTWLGAAVTHTVGTAEGGTGCSEHGANECTGCD